MTDHRNDDDDGLFVNHDTRHIIRTAVRFLLAMAAAVFLEWCVDKLEATGSYRIIALIFLVLAFTIMICDAIYLFIAIIVSFCRSVNTLLLSIGIDIVSILRNLFSQRFNVDRRSLLALSIFVIAAVIVLAMIYLQRKYTGQSK